jgi:hypothetical protein
VTPPQPTDTSAPQDPIPVSGRGLLAGSVAAAVDRVAKVRRSGGSGVEVSTQYRGGRVLGVALRETEVVVQVTAEALPLEPLVAAVRAAALKALRSLSDSRDVRVVVDDLDVNRLPRRRK